MLTHRVKGLHTYKVTGGINVIFDEKNVTVREERQIRFPKTMLCAAALIPLSKLERPVEDQRDTPSR
jgi:hypothetical protein